MEILFKPPVIIEIYNEKKFSGILFVQNWVSYPVQRIAAIFISNHGVSFIIKNKKDIIIAF